MADEKEIEETAQLIENLPEIMDRIPFEAFSVGVGRYKVADVGNLKQLVREWREMKAERSDILKVIREACKEYEAVADNDWPDGLHLGDALDKHFLNGLRQHFEETKIYG